MVSNAQLQTVGQVLDEKDRESAIINVIARAAFSTLSTLLLWMTLAACFGLIAGGVL